MMVQLESAVERAWLACTLEAYSEQQQQPLPSRRSRRRTSPPVMQASTAIEASMSEADARQLRPLPLLRKLLQQALLLLWLVIV